MRMHCCAGKEDHLPQPQICKCLSFPDSMRQCEQHEASILFIHRLERTISLLCEAVCVGAIVHVRTKIILASQSSRPRVSLFEEC
jgi:hypothetical protein